MYKKLVWILAVILFILAADRIIFTSSDIKIDMKPEVLRASVNSEMIIEVYRVNIIGFKVPFSKIEAQFKIEDGNNLIELSGEENGNSIRVRSKGVEGEATLGIYSVRSGMQIRKIIITVLPRDMALN
ncbi:MAG TPA: hypothetical protein VG961_09250 [Ignavibacteria bacterium]|nr:hypothetical protein [Ignavibacteria bacterium]